MCRHSRYSGCRSHRPGYDVQHAEGPDRFHRYGCPDPCHGSFSEPLRLPQRAECIHRGSLRNFHALPEAWRDGSRLAARQEMLHASYLAGFAFTNNFVGYVHAIAHAVGALYHIPHGRANAVLLPAVLREYGSCIAPKLAVLADALSLGGDTVSEKAERMIAAIEAMRDSFDIPSTLPHISPNDYTEIARRALKEANPTYPVPQIWDSEKIFSVLRRVQS